MSPGCACIVLKSINRDIIIQQATLKKQYVVSSAEIWNSVEVDALSHTLTYFEIVILEVEFVD